MSKLVRYGNESSGVLVVEPDPVEETVEFVLEPDDAEAVEPRRLVLTPEEVRRGGLSGWPAGLDGGC